MPLSRLLPLHLCSLQRATNGCAPFPAPRATIHPRTPVLAWSCTWCTCRAARDGGLSTCCLQQCCKAWHATKHGRNRMCRKCSMSTSLCAHPCMARARSPCARNLRPPWHPQAPYLCTAALAEPARKERQRAARRHKTAAAASGGCSSFGAEGVVCTPAESLGSHPTAALPCRGAQRHGSQLEPCRHAPSCRLLLATGSLARPCGCVRAMGEARPGEPGTALMQAAWLRWGVKGPPGACTPVIALAGACLRLSAALARPGVGLLTARHPAAPPPA